VTTTEPLSNHTQTGGMQVNADLHAHSGYAGGVGKISFARIDDMMSLKGITVVGTGDCLHPQWLDYLKKNLKETESGIFSFKERKTSFVLQTEVIMTSRINHRRKSVHTVILFPSFDTVDIFCRKLQEWGVKNTIGRPFIVCDNPEDVSYRLHTLKDIDPETEVVPAHVLTPDGIYGSNCPITHLHEFFGNFARRISAIETGLSADPTLLHLIPELNSRTWISNSDAHSHHLHRMGREFTTFELPQLTFSHLVRAIRENNVVRTAEFNPAEGRYFLTGHRGDRKGHNGQYCFFSPEHVPQAHTCPICSKNLTGGVLERVVTLHMEQSEGKPESRKPNHPGEAHVSMDYMKNIVKNIKTYQIEKPRNFTNMIPLVEIVARGLNIQSVTAKKVLGEYRNIVERVGSECELWFMEKDILKETLEGINPHVLEALLNINEGRFGFYPPGFDGEYGRLVLGTPTAISDIYEIYPG
jgi:DNA helicase-2/ATP-dependent DNA helicase PcrA